MQPLGLGADVVEQRGAVDRVVDPAAAGPGSG